MSSILFINNLNYEIDGIPYFKKFNLEIERGSWTSIIAPNKSGKSLLTKIICAIIPTYDICNLNSISLNKENVLEYITDIGIVSNDINTGFIYSKVKDELSYPLKNLGYSKYNIKKRVIKIIKFFDIENLINKNIEELSNSEKSKLFIIISLIHNPKLLVLDDAFNNMNKKDQEFMLEKLQELNCEGLTILNITSKLDTIYNSDKVIVMNDFKIEKMGTIEEIFLQDTYLKKIGLQIPHIVDLSLKLIFYNLIDKIYYNIDLLEEDLWK